MLRSLPRAGAAALLAASTALAALLNPVLSGLSGAADELIVAGAYPVGDLLLIAMLAGSLAIQGPRDDYGTGYSSLAYLRDLPVDQLKIDRSLVTDLLAHPRNAAIVRSTIDLAHSLELGVVAEGVEDAATLEALREMGCEWVQGYHFTKPLPADALVRWHRAFSLSS